MLFLSYIILKIIEEDHEAITHAQLEISANQCNGT